MPTYEQLKQRHPSCDPTELTRLNALYKGGAEFKKLLPELLPQRPAEPEQRYDLRLKEAHYRNYIGPVVDYFTAMLFSTRPVMAAKDGKSKKPVTEPDEFYAELQDDCDSNGHDVDALFKAQLTDAMVSGRSWVRVHAPSDGGTGPASLAEYDERGLGNCWLSAVDAADVLDWEHDDDGKLEWAIVHRVTNRRAGIGGSRSTVTETWEHIQVDKTDTYEVTYEKRKPPSKTASIPLVSSEPHKFGQVPLIPIALPVGLHVASRLETPQLAHFRLSNAQTWGFSSTCYAQPVFTLMDRDSMPTMGAGYGIIIGKDEKVEWAAPPSAHFTALAEEIKSQKDEIFRIAHQMALGVENNAAAVGRSGESKQQDALSTRVVLLAFSRIVKEAIEVAWDLISRHRGDGLKWSVEGLDDFAAADIMGLLDALEKVDKVGGVPSKTFNAEMKTRVAEALLPDITQAQKATIRKEIEEGVEKQAQEESELAAMTKDLQKMQLEPKPGQEPGAPKKPPFPPKKPQ
jgi:hypothetical protein